MQTILLSVTLITVSLHSSIIKTLDPSDLAEKMLTKEGIVAMGLIGAGAGVALDRWVFIPCSASYKKKQEELRKQAEEDERAQQIVHAREEFITITQCYDREIALHRNKKITQDKLAEIVSKKYGNIQAPCFYYDKKLENDLNQLKNNQKLFDKTEQDYQKLEDLIDSLSSIRESKNHLLGKILAEERYQQKEQQRQDEKSRRERLLFESNLKNEQEKDKFLTETKNQLAAVSNNQAALYTAVYSLQNIITTLKEQQDKDWQEQRQFNKQARKKWQDQYSSNSYNNNNSPPYNPEFNPNQQEASAPPF